MGFKTRFLLYTVPGQVFYNATRKLVLKGADAIVFVADSERGKMDENKESLSNLRANLAEYKVNLDDLPWVLQYNKRDLPDVYTVEELNRELNPSNVPWVEAVATKGTGVLETFRLVSQMLLERVTKDLKRSPSTGATREVPRPAPATPQPVPPPTLSTPTITPTIAGPQQTGMPLATPTPIFPAAPPPPAPLQSPPPFAGSARSEMAPTHPAFERAERTAAPAPPLRAIQKEGTGPDNGLFQRDVVLPGEGRSIRPSAGEPSIARTPAAGEPMVIPVTLDGSVREIVLRIVIEQPERSPRP
jgi:hypothetical protein